MSLSKVTLIINVTTPMIHPKNTVTLDKSQNCIVPKLVKTLKSILFMGYEILRPHNKKTCFMIPRFSNHAK